MGEAFWKDVCGEGESRPTVDCINFQGTMSGAWNEPKDARVNVADPGEDDKALCLSKECNWIPFQDVPKEVRLTIFESDTGDGKIKGDRKESVKMRHGGRWMTETIDAHTLALAELQAKCHGGKFIAGGATANTCKNAVLAFETEHNLEIHPAYHWHYPTRNEEG